MFLEINTHTHTVRKSAASNLRSSYCYVLGSCVLKEQVRSNFSGKESSSVAERDEREITGQLPFPHQAVCLDQGSREASSQLSGVTGLRCPFPVSETDPRPWKAVRGLGAARGAALQKRCEMKVVPICVEPWPRCRR